MRKHLLIVVMSLMAASLALADVQCPSGAGISWQTYLTTFDSTSTCHLGNLDFSNFGYATGGTNQILASSVGIDTLTAPGNEGFLFNPAINIAGNNLSSDASFFFTVTAINGAVLNDLFIHFNGAFTNNPGGVGAGTSFSETQTGGTCTPSCAVIQVTNPPPDLTEHVVFNSPVHSLQIEKDIVASTGTNGQASISIVENRFSNVPEPRMISVLMMGLLAAFGLSRKFKSVVS